MKKLTIQEYRNLEFDDNDPYFYELIDGELVKKRAPRPSHQRIARKLLIALDSYISKNQLGELFFSPIDVFLDENNAPQPDLVFIAKALETIITDNRIEGVPTLVIEIISPTSILRDRITKK